MNKNKLKLFLIIFLTAAAGFLAVFMLIQKIEFSITAVQIVLLCLIAILGIFINTFLHMLFHETGHLIFGKISGFKLYRLTIWFLSIEKKVGKKGFKFKIASSKYGGVSQMMPSSDKNLYKKFASYVLGGLWGSFFTVAGFLIILLLVDLNNIVVIYIYAGLLTGFPLSVYFFFLNAVPFSARGLSNDGGIIKGLIKNSPETKIYINVLAIQSKLYAGLSPSEIDEKFYFDVPVVADNCISKILLLNLRYNYFLDKLDFEKASETIQQLTVLKRYIPDIYTEQILADRFFNAVFYLKNYETGKRLYSKIKESIESNNDICTLRIKMAYELFIENSSELAASTGKAALKLKDNYPLKGLVKMEEKIINILFELSKQ